MLYCHSYPCDSSPNEQAAGVFSCGTDGCVCTFSLQNLIKNLPEQKELSNLAELKNEYEELCESEQFGIVVSTEIVVLKITSTAPADFRAPE